MRHAQTFGGKARAETTNASPTYDAGNDSGVIERESAKLIASLSEIVTLDF